ncbi:hypothetical protein [Paenibacillus ihbetae]|uniref:Uncharacterized protein n=1 Tax=Paenibacillus ihbetae TaxID=1870820 RepID=A0A1B2E6J1_9BACL|nr:hypothetical protein [Paenibacillus ihbetae]ANY75579.1 hypothetical protein BBD41_25055 [Paenibacillus ihbetae]OOC62246.1 hypothetical protein BBD40_10485 [Paenibacillus ihbetae]
MNRKGWQALLLSVLLVLAGCSGGGKTPTGEQTDAPKEEAKQENPVSPGTDEQAGTASGEDDEASDAAEAGGTETADAETLADAEIVEGVSADGDATLDPNIWIKGDIQVEDNQVIVEGTSNLPAGIEVNGEITARGYTMFGYNDDALTENDGSYRLEIKRPDITKDPLDLTVNIQPEDLSEPIQKVLGAKGELLTGPYVHQYLSGDDEIHYEIRATARIKPGAGQARLEEPAGEKPDDQGNPEVWIKPLITLDDRNYYVSGESNLLEGTEVQLNIDIPGKIHTGYFDRSQVGPDGRFLLQIAKPKNVGEFYMMIRVKPDEDMWPTVKEAYGEHGEKLKGKHVKTEVGDSGNVKYVEVKVKVNGKQDTSGK